MPDTPFDEQEIINLTYTITTDNPFVERDVEYQSRRDLLYQRRFVSIPGVTIDAYGNPRSSMVQYRSPEIEDDGHSFKNRMLAAGLKINVASVKKNPQAKSAAQKQEDFFYRHYYRWRDLGVFDGPLFDMATIGIGWTHLSLNTDLLPMLPDYNPEDPLGEDVYFDLATDELEKFTSGEKPDLFVLEPIDAATMYWSPDKKIRIQKALVPMNPLVLLYGQRGKQIDVDERGNVVVNTLAPGQNVMVYRTNWARMCTLYTVEDDDFCYHLMFNKAPQYSELRTQGAVLGTYKNIFKTPAFFYCAGEKTSDHHPLYQFRPLLNGKYQTVPVKNILNTSMATAGSEASQQRYSLEWIGGQPVPEDDTNIAVTITDDGVLVPPAGYKLVNSGLQVGPDLPAALEAISKQDTYGYPKALGNPQEISASSGYDRARMQDAVASLLDPPLSHFGTMQAEIFTAMRNGVIELGLPITIRTVEERATGGRAVTVQTESTLKPDEASEDADISVSFNSVTIFSRIAMKEEGLKEMQADQLTETQYQTEIAGVDNLEEWRNQRALDKVYKLADDLAVAHTEQLLKQLADAANQKVMQQNGIPPPAAPPQVPGAMVQTNGQQLRSDRGPSMPIGPGGAMPVAPTPPGPAELGQEAPMPVALQ